MSATVCGSSPAYRNAHASRLLFPCSTGCLSRGSTRRPTRAQPLHGANRHGGNHLQRHGSSPSDQPFDQIECQLGPKIPHDPASFVARTPPGNVGQKENGKAPSVAGGAPEKIPVRNCQRTRNILGSPAQGGLKNTKLPHRSGRAIETAHDETPEMKISNSWRSCLRRRAQVGFIRPNRTGSLYAISQLGERRRRRVGRARMVAIRKRPDYSLAGTKYPERSINI